jgi:hypothetical protein
MLGWLWLCAWPAWLQLLRSAERGALCCQPVCAHWQSCGGLQRQSQSARACLYCCALCCCCLRHSWG